MRIVCELLRSLGGQQTEESGTVHDPEDVGKEGDRNQEDLGERASEHAVPSLSQALRHKVKQEVTNRGTSSSEKDFGKDENEDQGDKNRQQKVVPVDLKHV